MATSKQTLIVKLHFGTDIRRFTVDAKHVDSDLTWASLSERVSRSFELFNKEKKFKVTYVDDEKDVITISTDDELKEAVALALTSEPSVLRLTISKKDKHPLHAAEAAKHADTPPPEAKAPADKTPEAPKMPAVPGVPPELTPFLESLAKQLPVAMANLPEGLKAFLPHAELDLAATVAANTPAGREADPFCPADPHAADAPVGVHEGVTCDMSGVCPIVGNRYHLIGHNYDLCEAEFNKLSEKKKALFRKVAPPGDKDDTTAPAGGASLGVHPGITCDRSGQSPIVGTRFHLRGHNYDVCQAEFDKLPDNEKSLYTAIPPPELGGGGAWRPGPWGWRGGGCHGKKWGGMGHGGNNGHGQGHGGNGHGHGHGGEPKLAARFVRDVTIFDGTQMAPGTTFTKIWRLKNVGDVPWPPGARMLFVGGDQMTNEMSVPLSRASAVMPGEEVDVAVEMTAPTEHGRYLGYWRLTGPFMRRKFGQRVWCHVQVVDPSASGAEGFEDLQTTLAEIERKKSDLADKEGEEKDDDDELEVAKQMSLTKTDKPVDVSDATDAKEEAATATKEEKEEEEEAPAAVKPVAATLVGVAAQTQTPDDDAPAADIMKDGTASDDGVLVTTDGVPADAPAAAGSLVAPAGSAAGVGGVRAELGAMGFTDSAMIDAVIEKNGGDVEASARDLASATEWDHLLDDLAEMGFGNRHLNTTLMLKNGGNMKRTVRDLVEA